MGTLALTHLPLAPTSIDRGAEPTFSRSRQGKLKAKGGDDGHTSATDQLSHDGPSGDRSSSKAVVEDATGR